MNKKILISFARIAHRLGSKKPAESAILILAIFHVSLLILALGIIKIIFGYLIDKNIFLLLSAIVIAFDLFTIDKIKDDEIYTQNTTPVEVFISVLIYFACTTGICLLIIPIARYFK